jgi:uncharacterized protein YjbI with pentapeptide repeats
MPDALPYPRSSSETEEWLKGGKPIEFPKDRPGSISVTDWKVIRTITPHALRSLFAKETREATVPVRLKNAIIAGELLLAYRRSKFEFCIMDTDFRGLADFSFFTFDGAADFLSSRFYQGAKFNSSRFAYDLRLSGAVFRKQAGFQAVEVQGRLFAIGVRLQNAHFANAKFAKSAVFKSKALEDRPVVRTKFSGDAKFPDVRFDGTAEFDGAAFLGKTDFSRCTFGGNANFKPAQFSETSEAKAVEFRAQALFRDVVISGSGDLRAARFLAEANFQRSKVGANFSFGSVKARNGPLFASIKGPALFDGVQISGRAVFEGTAFGARCSFESAHVGGNALFRGARESGMPASFGAEANFLDAKIDGTADFSGAIFAGTSNFRRTNIGGSAFFRTLERSSTQGERGSTPGPPLRVEFHGEVLWDDLSIAGSLFLQGCWFAKSCKNCSFRRMQVGANGFLGHVVANENLVISEFEPGAIFAEARFGGSLFAGGVHFGGKAVFDRSQIGGAVYFGPAEREEKSKEQKEKSKERERKFEVAVFGGGIYARDCDFGGRADFSGAHYLVEADFSRTKFGSGAFFSSLRRSEATLPTRFSAKRFRLYRAEIEGDLECEGVEFDCPFDCEAVHVKGNAIFRSLQARDADLPATQVLLTIFKKASKFLNASIDGVADFSGAVFAETANFSRVKIGGPAFFRRLADVRANAHPAFQEISFVGAVFSGGADFDGVKIAKNATFTEATFGASSRFSRMVCEGRANFDLAEIDGTASFQRSLFKGVVTMRDARAGTVNFGASNEDVCVFQPGLDLRGFTYIRLVGDWKEIFGLLALNDLEPYSQLEKSFRNTGNERDADAVYLARHGEERRAMKQIVFGGAGDLTKRVHSAARLVEDSILRWLFNYGVPSYRMVWVACLLVVAGILLLSNWHALSFVAKADTFLERPRFVRIFYGTVSFVDLLLHQSPESSLTQWKPSGQKCLWVWGPTYRQMSVVLSIAVYSCITLAAASLAGLIKRKQT